MGGKEDSAGGLFDGLPAAEDHGDAAPKSQAVPQARKHVVWSKRAWGKSLFEACVCFFVEIV